MKQPDVFEKMVMNVRIDESREGITGEQCINLLRVQHRKVRKMVEIEMNRMVSGAFSVTNHHVDQAMADGHKIACRNLIDALDAMVGKKVKR